MQNSLHIAIVIIINHCILKFSLSDCNASMQFNAAFKFSRKFLLMSLKIIIMMF